MKIEIEIPQCSDTDAIMLQVALQTIAKNLNKGNVQFIADLSKKTNINKKLESKKTLIKSYI